MIIFIIVIVLIVLAAWGLYSYFIGRVEKLDYTVEDGSKEYEIRGVDDYLISETQVAGTFRSAGNSAFRILADYIFGNNKKKQKIEMTTPVIETQSEKIAMTAPVISKEGDQGNIDVSFVLPSKYNLENVPDPVDDRVKIRKVAKKKIAVLKFRGSFSDKLFDKKRKILTDALTRDKIKYGKIYSARYSPPTTPPPLSKNEVWADIVE